MSDAKNSSREGAGADYEVGYGKPPRHTRFQPGRSGNPRGRVVLPRSQATRLSC